MGSRDRVGSACAGHLESETFFRRIATEFGAAPNAQVSFVDAAFPGMLPVINGYCVEQAVKTGLGLNAKINLSSVFDRKNYFYPDLPAGYQISANTSSRSWAKAESISTCRTATVAHVGIERLHLEQDAGKSLHDQNPDYTYVDLNRAGVALMEIVSRPDLRSSDGSGGLSRQTARDPALSRHLRRQYGRRFDARGCQCFGAPAGRATRHALRNQEREFHALRRAGGRI